MPWQVRLSGLSAGLQTERSLVPFPVRPHAWVAGQVPRRGCVRGNHTLMFLSISLSLPSPLSKKINKILKKKNNILKTVINLQVLIVAIDGSEVRPASPCRNFFKRGLQVLEKC